MQLLYNNSKVQKQCTDLKTAKKLFGGNAALATSLFARINAMQQANVIKDIVMMPTFHFHKLNGNMDGFFAIDVKTRRDPWRIIIQPLDENEEPYDPCNIDEIAGVVRIVEVKEVSNHYGVIILNIMIRLLFILDTISKKLLKKVDFLRKILQND